MSANVERFYLRVEASNYPKNTGTPIEDVEAFIAKHGVTDLDANPDAKPRKLNFKIRGDAFREETADELNIKRKQAKAEYRAALKNLDSGKTELRVKDENRLAVTPKPIALAVAPKPTAREKAKLRKIKEKTRIERAREYERLKRLKARDGKPSQRERKVMRLADMEARLLCGESIEVADKLTNDESVCYSQRRDFAELSKKLDLVKSGIRGSDKHKITLRKNIMNRPVDMTPFKGREELKRRLLDGQTVLTDVWIDKRNSKQVSITNFIDLHQIDIIVIYEVAGNNKVIGWQIADK